jgi:uncharacterized protein (UPF0179 family)
MRSKLVLVAVLTATIAQAQEAKKYHSGHLLQMESLQCTVFENPSSDASSVDSAMCEEYVLQGDDVLFHLRAKDAKHPLLLPVGKSVSYRIAEDRFFVKLSSRDRKEHEYQVVSMEARERPEAAVQSAMKINHLQ